MTDYTGSNTPADQRDLWRTPPSIFASLDAEFCEACGEDIPAPRRAAVPGCQTCAECQGVIELRNKQRGM